METDQQYHWWEKTIEYLFVLEASKTFNFVAPFDYQHERAGDAIFGVDSRMILVEFKKRPLVGDDERKKYTSFEDAKEALKSKDEHHFLIGGVLTSEHGQPTLELSARRYFQGQGETKDPKEILAKGIAPSAFDEYLDELLRYKKGSSEDSGGASGISSSSYASVLGVTAVKGTVTSMPLVEYRHLSHQLKLTNSHSLTTNRAQILEPQTQSLKPRRKPRF